MSFSQIKGQELAQQILQGYTEQGRLQGGLLFVGPEGVGKKKAALTLAKAVNCAEGPLDSCDRCPSCLKIEKNQHPDIHLIAAEDSQIRIESIRQLKKDISFKPYEAEKSVFIIDDAHRLNAEASNALLKILEEPPRDSLIILVTDKPALLFKTILSRCKMVKYPPLPRERLQDILRKDYGLDFPGAHYLAYVAEGRFGRALKLKETDTLREKNAVIDQFLFVRNPSIEQLSKQEKEKIKSDLNILSTWFRDIYLIKVGMPHSEIIHEDRKSDLLKATSLFSFPELFEIMDSLVRAIHYLERNINTKLLLYDLRSQLWKG